MNDSELMSGPPTDPSRILVASNAGVTLPSMAKLTTLLQLPLPGIVIFVHGVNSNGEWYEQAEQGLCAGLNERLKRCDEHMKYCGVEAGQLTPVSYISELTPDGFLNRERSARTFLGDSPNFSPVIRFRWGYKASVEELKEYGANIYLNEQNYWGGGPFANGCSSLPDLWNEGVNDQLFLWIHAQHLNPTPDRQVYACPPRPYFVLAAYRLAKLIETIRNKQADVPITIVCHSQGNMVAICAAFLGDTLPPAVDPAGKSSKCIADTYVLCNPPYSMLESNFTENFSQFSMKDTRGYCGRETLEARTQTMKAFFELIKSRQGSQQLPETIDKRMANEAHGFTADQDRKRFGLGGQHVCGRVTLYCNPHDQVISATTVQGIGWRGMSQGEIDACGGSGVFTQRVWAHDFEVGTTVPQYRYWQDHWKGHGKGLKYGSDDFWYPHSQSCGYYVKKGLDANTNIFGKLATVVFAPIGELLMKIAAPKINGTPPQDWTIPLQAPPLPEPFKPMASRLGEVSEQFDEAHDPTGDNLDANRALPEDDPYRGYQGARKGNTDSESAMRYENHAVLRMKAKRAGYYKSDEQVVAEDDPTQADEKYKQWQRERVLEILQEGVNVYATDHSTILTNPMHSQKALAYDVAVGVCDISPQELRDLRVAADWQLAGGVPQSDPMYRFGEYFDFGTMEGGKLAVKDWANAPGSEVALSKTKIVDQRSTKLLQLTGAGA